MGGSFFCYHALYFYDIRTEVMVLENDIFAEVFDGAIDQFFEQNITDEEQEFENEESINPSLRTDIENLLTSGSISKEIELAGHFFVMRTLTIGEELAIAEICSAYDGNFAQAKAIATATVALFPAWRIHDANLVRSLKP